MLLSSASSSSVCSTSLGSNSQTRAQPKTPAFHKQHRQPRKARLDDIGINFDQVLEYVTSIVAEPIDRLSKRESDAGIDIEQLTNERWVLGRKCIRNLRGNAQASAWAYQCIAQQNPVAAFQDESCDGKWHKLMTFLELGNVCS
jgi:hypothetical protein